MLVLGVWGNWWFKGEPSWDEDRPSYLDDAGFEIELDIGLREVSQCTKGICGSTDLEALGAMYGGFDEEDLDDDDAYERDEARSKLKKYTWAAGVTFWSGMVAAGSIALSILLWTMRQRLPFSLPAVGTALAGVTAIAGTAALMFKPEIRLMDLLSFDIKMSVGYPLTVAGCVLTAVGGYLLHKESVFFPQLGTTPVYGGYAPPPPYVGGPQPGYGAPPPPPPHVPMMAVSPACPRCSAPTVFVPEHQRYFCSSCRAYL